MFPAAYFPRGAFTTTDTNPMEDLLQILPKPKILLAPSVSINRQLDLYYSLVWQMISSILQDTAKSYP